MQLAPVNECEQQTRETLQKKREESLSLFTELTLANLDGPDDVDSEVSDNSPFISNTSSGEQLKLPQKLNRKNVSQRISPRLSPSLSVKRRNYASLPIPVKDGDSERQIDVYKERACQLERVKKRMQYDMDEMRKTIDDFKYCTEDEKGKNRDNVMELELLNVKYKLEKEVEEKETAETLCNQLKGQLNVIEGRLTEESDLRISLGTENQKQKTDLQMKDQQIDKLECDMQELKSRIENEMNARVLQNERNLEVVTRNEHLSNKLDEMSINHADVVRKLEVSEKELNQTQTSLQSVSLELTQTKNELVLTQSLRDDIKSSSADELAKLREKLEGKTEKLVVTEKDLFRVQLQYENETRKRISMEERLENNDKAEMKAQLKFEEEICLLKHQLEKSKAEFDHLETKFKAADYEYNSTMLGMNNERKCLEKELGDTEQKLSVAHVKLSDAETETTRLTDELKSIKLALTESKAASAGTCNILQETENTVVNLKEDLRKEQMENTRLEGQLETARERIMLLQAECEDLSHQLKHLREESTNYERMVQEKENSTDLLIAAMKEDFKVEKTDLLRKNEQGNLLLEKMQNELNEKEEALKEAASELSNRTHELGNITKDINFERSEKSLLEIEVKKLTRENSDATDTIGALRTQMQSVTREKDGLKMELKNIRTELETSKEVCAEMTQRVQKKGKDLEGVQLENHETKSALQEAKRRQLVIEADLREEKVRSESMRQDLIDAKKARESLEGLITNMKANHTDLEEQLKSEIFTRTKQEQEIAEHKGLLELEMKSRSQIGVKVIELEKQTQGMKNKVEEEQRKGQKALDQIEVYEKRSLQHRQEVSDLRNKLKVCQRRLKDKDCDANESRLPTLRAEFEVERQAMSTNLYKLRRQLDQLSEQLSSEQNMRDAEEKKNRQQQEELTDLKTNEKVQAYELEKVKRKCCELQEELERQREYYESNFLPAEEVEGFKKSLETKVQMDLHKKLQEVNMLVEEQTLARRAIDNLRDGAERQSKTGYEETVAQLKNDLSEVKASLDEELVKRDTPSKKARQFNNLFESERNNSQRLEGKLLEMNERNRTNYLFNEGKSKVNKKLFEESFGKIKNDILSSTVQDSVGSNIGHYRPKSWSTPLRPSYKSPFTLPDPLLSSIKRRNLLT